MTQPGGEVPERGAPGWSAPGSVPDAGYAAPPGSAAPPPPASPGHAQPGWGPPGYTYTPQQPGPGAAPTQPHWTAVLSAHKPGIVPLRPLGLGDILEGSFAALRRNPRTMFGLSFVVSLVVVLGLAAIGAIGYLAVLNLGTGGMSDALVTGTALGGLSLLYLVTAITGVALTGMLSYPVGEAVLGRTPGLGETWRRTRRMVPRLTGLCLVLLVPSVVVFGGIIALVAVAFSNDATGAGLLLLLALAAAAVLYVFVAIRLVLATPALVLEELGVVAALRRSWGLTAGRFWRTFGVLLVAGLLVAVVQQVLSVAFQVLGGILGAVFVSPSDDDGALFALVILAVSLLGVALSALVTQPFSAAVSALLYTDERIRKEGFDLALSRAAASAPPVGR